MIDFDCNEDNIIRSIAILIVMAVVELVGLLTIGYFLYWFVTEHLVPFLYRI